MRRVGVGIGLLATADREGARRLFSELWTDVGGDDGDAFHRCAIAHSMADAQDDLRSELTWDLAALRAADALTDDRALAGGLQTVESLYPSLHLNLAACYRRLGDRQRARHHVDLGRAASEALGDGGYDMMVRTAIERLAEQLA
jgi:hypothetical protein